MSALPPSPENRDLWRSTWFGYYTEKRVPHQWMQVSLLRDLSVRRILEVGPYLGLVTAMLDNAGYDVTTLDITPRHFESPDVAHIRADLTTTPAQRLSGFDLILCCETLEHLTWEQAGKVLRMMAATDARWLITSVPYEGTQLEMWLAINPFRWRRRFTFKGGRSLRRFRPDPDPFGHKWECGFRGYALAAWENALQDSGWRIRRRDFTFGCRSVFHVLENTGVANATVAGAQAS